MTQPEPSPVGAYDLFYETPDGVSSSSHPRARRDTHPRPDQAPWGWIGSAGPAIDPATWPRSSQTGLPMLHVLTLRLPVEHQRRSSELPAIALFQGQVELQAAGSGPRGDDDDPFLLDLAGARHEPRFERLTDFNGGVWALAWLTEAEVAGGPTPPPADVRRPGTHDAPNDGPDAWQDPQPTRRVWVARRPDPNAGIAPVGAWAARRPEHAASPYVQPLDTDARALHPWAEPIADRDHLGGTAFPYQELPEGLTPHYLELTELPGMNLGDGRLQLDLETSTVEWAN